jgi:hypothetical protein
VASPACERRETRERNGRLREGSGRSRFGWASELDRLDEDNPLLVDGLVTSSSYIRTCDLNFYKLAGCNPVAINGDLNFYKLAGTTSRHPVAINGRSCCFISLWSIIY